MKVHDIVKKINYARAKQEVYIRTGWNEPRKLSSVEFENYFYDEKYCTVTSIDLEENRMIINYKT